MKVMYTSWMWFTTTVLILSSFTDRIQGELDSSPSGTLLVCGVGEQADIICTTTESVLRWTLTVPGDTTRTRLQAHSTKSPTATPFEIGSSTITFTRTSAQDSLPFTSRLRIENASESLNGTVINCTEVGVGLTNPETSSAVVFILGQDFDYEYSNPPEVSTRNNSEQFETNAVTLILDWTQEMITSVSYTVRVTSLRETVITRSVESTSVQLTLPYNTLVNVSIITNACNRTLSEATVILQYTTCNHPSLRHKVKVDNFDEPLIKGTSVTFSCLPNDRLVLIGPNETTCIDDGQWQPDPDRTMCEVDCGHPSKPTSGYIIHHNGTVQGSKVTIACQSEIGGYIVADAVCDHHGNWEPNISMFCTSMSGLNPVSRNSTNTLITTVASSVGVFILSSILFFLVGFFCGRFNRREKSPCNGQTSDDKATHSPSPHQSVLYEDILPALAHQETNLALSAAALASSDLETRLEDDLELKENVAYGPLKSTIEM